MILDDCSANMKQLLERFDSANAAYAESHAVLAALSRGEPVPPGLTFQLTLPNGSVIPIPADTVSPALAQEYVYQAAAFLGQYVTEIWKQIHEVGSQGWNHCAAAIEKAANEKAVVEQPLLPPSTHRLDVPAEQPTLTPRRSPPLAPGPEKR